MFSAIRELTPPGTVVHSTAARFTQPQNDELLVSRSRQLEVYRIEQGSGALKLEAEFTLDGAIESIEVIRADEIGNDSGDLYGKSLGEEGLEEEETGAAGGKECDLLALTFGTGRMTIVKYDPDLGPHLLRTLALYNFETDALGSNLRADSSGMQTVHGYGNRGICVVDPQMRCAAMLVNGFQVAVMPFDRLKGILQSPASSSIVREEGQEQENNEQNELDVANAEQRKIKLARAVRKVAMEAEDVWEMPSGSYLVDLSRLGIPAASIQHMEFMHGQNGLPVLAILHSGWIKGGTGRLVVSRCTTHLTAITLSKQDVTVVWKVRKLPHDSFAVAPMRNGDVIVLAQNSVHHIVGGFVRRSMEMNGFSRFTADIDPVTDGKSPVELILDGARWAWLDPFRLLLSLRFGQLVVLDIGLTAIRVSVQGLSSQATTMSVVDGKYLFLGSRLADSLLMTYRLFVDESGSSGTEFIPSGEPSVDEEERALYSGESPTSTSSHGPKSVMRRSSSLSLEQNSSDGKKPSDWLRLKRLGLQTIDALPCIGPIGGLCLGENAPDIMEAKRAEQQAKELQKKGLHSAAARVLKMAKESGKSRRRPKEILVPGGRARDGGVRVMCPALRLDTVEDLVMDKELASPAQSIWTLNPTPSKSETLVLTTLWNSGSFQVHRLIGDGSHHSFDELAPEDKASFEVSTTPTLAVHSYDRLILQACLDKVILTENCPPFKELARQEESIRAAVACEKFVLVLLRSRIPKLYEIDPQSACLKEVDNIFKEISTPAAPVVSIHIFRHFDPEKKLSQILCGLVRGGVAESGAGALEVYNVSEKQLLFRSDKAVALGHRVLSHRAPHIALDSNQGVLAKIKVVSLCIASVGRIDEDPYSAASLVGPRLCVALAMASGDMLLYRVEENWERLSRVQTDLVTRIDRNLLNRSGRNPKNEDEQQQQQQQQQNTEENSSANFADRNHKAPTADEDLPLERKRTRSAAFGGDGNAEHALGSHQSAPHDQDLGLDRTEGAGWKANRPTFRSNPRFISFEYLGGFCGMIFVNGMGTSVCVLGSRGFIKPVRLDFDAYHVWNMTVTKGKLCILATSKTSSRNLAMESAARLMVFTGLKLMQHLRLDAGGSMPFIQVPLQCSVTRVAFDAPSRCYLMLCSEDDAGEERALVVRSSCFIRLLCADTLSVLHQYSLMRHEKAITIQSVTIDLAAQNTTPRKLTEFLAVGTGFVGPDGEDSGCKGRVLIFQVETIKGENNIAPQKKISLRLKIESRHIRGPVTSLSSVDGMLLATFGTTPSSLRIFYFDPTTEEFVARSFIDTPFSAMCMKSIKNYILVGDMYRSVQFLHWHNMKREFRVLAKDHQPLQVYSCEFLQYERSLGMVVSDSDENLHVMQFDHNKNALLNQGEIHLATAVNDMMQVQIAQDKTIVLYGTLDGALGAVVPMSEQVYRRLFALQAAMSSSPLVPRNAGLNPRAYRNAQYHFVLQRQRRRNIADGALLWSYLHLDNISQRQLARLIGTTPETVHQDLLELDTLIFNRAL